MIIVKNLDKGLHFRPLLDFLLAHSLNNLARVTVDTGYYCMPVRLVGRSVVVVLKT